MALDPTGVDMARVNTDKWYIAPAVEASADHGRRAVDMILVRLRKLLMM
jgi:hypothetical protein